LPEAEFGFGLRSVGRNDVSNGPAVAVGEQDPFAEQAVFQFRAGAGVGAPGQPEAGRVVAGEGSGDDLADSAGFEDGGDVGLDLGAVAAGVAAVQPGLQLAQAGAGLGQGLVQATRLGGVQRR
jgi:hypothetical protein